MAIGNCDCCDRRNVPVSSGYYDPVGDTTACFICQGETDPDPYGEIVEPCDQCGGDGGWSYPVSHDPFRNTIREAWQECTACGGTGEAYIELLPAELEDLEEFVS